MKILIADNFVIVRRGIRQILAEAFPSALIEETGDYPDLISKAKSHDWNIIISDFTMPGGGGIHAIKEIKETKPTLPILVISFNTGEQYAIPVLNAGANGFLNKASTSSDLVKAVNQILGGETFISDMTEKHTAAFEHPHLVKGHDPIKNLNILE